MSDAFLGYLLAVVGLLFFSTGILITKIAANRIQLSLGFLVATATNVVFAGLALVVQLLLRNDVMHWNLHAFWMFALAGAFTSYLGRWFFYDAVVRFGPSRASIFQISSPLFTALMAWLWLGEKLTWQLMLGMLMTVGGLMLVSAKPGLFLRSTRTAGSAKGSAEGMGEDVVPAGINNKFLRRMSQSMLLVGMGSALAYAVGNLLRGSAIRDWSEPIVGALTGATCGLVLHIAFSSGKADLWRRLRASSRSGVLLYIVIGTCTISGQILAIWAMRYIPVAVAALLTLCSPLLVFPLSWLMFRNQEKLTVTIVVGGMLTLAGIFLLVLR